MGCVVVSLWRRTNHGGTVHGEADGLSVMMPICEVYKYPLCSDEMATSCSCQYKSHLDHPRYLKLDVPRDEILCRGVVGVLITAVFRL